MIFFSRFFNIFRGNATEQRKGQQDITPVNSVHDDTFHGGIDGALQVSTVWACVTLIVENIASLPLMVYSTDGEGRRAVDRDSRTYHVLHDNPNGQQTAIEFWEQMMLNYVLRGNAYAVIEQDKNGVIALWPKPADQMTVVVQEDNSLKYYFTESNNKVIDYTQKQILHIRGMGNGTVGMSPLDYMRASVGLSISSQNHTNKTFKKEARRPGILMSDTVLTPEQRTAVKKNFGDIASGAGRELYVLEAQFKFEPLGMSPADIQLLETRRFSVQDLARWFGVPSILINDTAESTSLGSSVEQIISGFHKLKLRPLLERIEQALYQRVLTSGQRAKGIVVEFNLDALLRSSLAERMDVYSKAAQNGVYTRNECRRRENLEPLPGGDMLTAQSNLLPLEKLGEQPQSTGAVPPDPIKQ
jgi:HK97 family phage portal protein